VGGACRVWVWDVGCRVLGVGCVLQGAGCRVLGIRRRVLGVGCRVSAFAFVFQTWALSFQSSQSPYLLEVGVGQHYYPHTFSRAQFPVTALVPPTSVSSSCVPVKPSSFLASAAAPPRRRAAAIVPLSLLPGI